MPSEPQESETPGTGDQRDKKSPGTGIQELTYLMKSGVGSLERLFL